MYALHYDSIACLAKYEQALTLAEGGGGWLKFTADSAFTISQRRYFPSERLRSGCVIDLSGQISTNRDATAPRAKV